MNSGIRSNLRAAMYPWLASRAAIGFGLAVVHSFRGPFTRIGTRHNIVGLFGWDASFYREIAQHGYRAVEQTDGLRFFPLYPLVARLLGGSDVALLAVSNLAALGALALLHHLTLLWTSSAQGARRAVWIMALGPGVAASMMGYAEPLFLVLAIGCCVALHQQSVALAALLGAGAALTRPVGALLVVVFVGDALQRRRPFTLLGATGPIAGLVAYLAWAHDRTGDWLTPLRLQGNPNLRGDTVDPVRAVWASLRAVVIELRVGPGLHLVWAIVAVVLCVVAWRKLPFAGASFATVAVATSLTTRNLDSFERYLYAAFPLAIAASTLRLPKWVDRLAQVTAPLVVATYAALAFATKYVP